MFGRRLLDWFGSLVLDPVGLAIWGPIAAVISIDASLWTAAGLLVAGALVLLVVPEIRHLPAFPPYGEAPDMGHNRALELGGSPSSRM